MPSLQPMDILKEAHLLERRGRAFYLQVAAQTASRDVADFFETMAAEEHRHMQVLEKQMRSVSDARGWVALESEDADAGPLADTILSDETKAHIAGADFEAAAVTAAMLMEEKAVTLYTSRAEAARNPEERNLFQWLADWEKGHLSFLAALDREIRERVWNDNNFWPF